MTDAAGLDYPTPMNVGVPGCQAMMRAGARQWAHCPRTPEIAGTVGRGARRYLVFACELHVGHVDHLRPMTDADRAELEHRREQWRRAKRGLPFERVQPIK